MKPSELFKCTNWEFNLAFSRERKTATKSHPCSPCIQDTSPAALLTTWSQKEYAFNVDRVWKVQRVYRWTPRTAPPSQARVTQGLPRSPTLRFSCQPSCSLQLTLSRHLSHQTKYISQPAVRPRKLVSLRFHVLRLRKAEGRQKKKIWISKFSQPTGWRTDWWQQNLAWLWSINVSAIIKLAQQIKLCCNCARFPVQPLLFTRGEHGRSMPCFPEEIDSLQWFRSRMPEADQRKALLKIGRGQHTRMIVYI